MEEKNDSSVKPIKCVVWDLDNTLWQGVLLEDTDVRLREGVENIIKTLDSRGILQSIASRNDKETAIGKLQEFGLDEYFLYPQINWNSKAESVKNIAELINIGVDTFAFVDDQAFERADVKFSLPEVRCIDAADLSDLLERSDLMPRFITQDSKIRRQMYLSDIQRNLVEEHFVGSKEEFLASLSMNFSIFPAQEDDLQRAEELTVRTNQLNATGYTYSYQELDQFRHSGDYQLLMARLDDKYGSYGNIGLALVECKPQIWTIKLLLMSCRVMSRGVGTIMLSYLIHQAKEKGVRLLAEFVPTSRNRMMEITYRFSNFTEVERHGKLIILENYLDVIPQYPDYVGLQLPNIEEK